MLTLEQIDNRLNEIPKQLESIVAERNQLLGYKKALEDADVFNKPGFNESKEKPKQKAKKMENDES